MKNVGNNIYVHRSALSQLDMKNSRLVIISMGILSKSFPAPAQDTEIIKIDKKNQSVSFIYCSKFDSMREPIVEDAYKVYPNGIIKITKEKSNPQIYHHKWMFVESNYTKFSIEESKQWSDTWTQKIPKSHSSRIGYKNYWDSILREHDLEVE